MQSLVDMAGMPQDTCLCFTLQVLELLPTILLDIFFCTPLPMMLAYGLESHSSWAWLKNEEAYGLESHSSWAWLKNEEAYGLESHSSWAWLKNEEETYSLGEMARASHILSKKLRVDGQTGDRG